MLFVSHDLAVVRTVADRAIVMRDGLLVRGRAPPRSSVPAPAHPYTVELLSSIPDIADVRPRGASRGADGADPAGDA